MNTQKRLGLSKHTRTRLLFRNGKKVRAHRWIMEQHIGRRLLSNEVVHHIDGDPLNNELSNLLVMDETEHQRLHKRIPLAYKDCAYCGESFLGQGKHRHRQKCCSKECAQTIRVEAALATRRRIMEHATTQA